MPVWFWAVDPGVRRCIMTGKTNRTDEPGTRVRRRFLLEVLAGPGAAHHTQAAQREVHRGTRGDETAGGAASEGGGGGRERGGEDSDARGGGVGRGRAGEAAHRRLSRDPYGGRLATEPCLASPPVVPFAFDRVKGLPERCVDALGLCVGESHLVGALGWRAPVSKRYRVYNVQLRMRSTPPHHTTPLPRRYTSPSLPPVLHTTDLPPREPQARSQVPSRRRNCWTLGWYHTPSATLASGTLRVAHAVSLGTTRGVTFPLREANTLTTLISVPTAVHHRGGLPAAQASHKDEGRMPSQQ